MDNIVIHIISRTCWINGWLTLWLNKQNKKYEIVFNPYDVVMGRNTSIRDFLENTNGEYLIQIDDDSYPFEDTEKIFSPIPDIVTYCGSPTRSLRGSNKDGELQLNVVCIPRTILEKIKPPWFDPKMDECKSKWVEGDVNNFRDKIIDLGYATKVIGQVGHLHEMVVKYDKKGKLKIRNPKWII